MEVYYNGCLVIFRTFYDALFCEHAFETLQNEVKWLSKHYHNADGSTVYLPRLTANYGEESYDYSGLTFQPVPWTPFLTRLKADADALAKENFNALVLQLYRDGKDRVGWHADEDACVGQNPSIVSISFGETRSFWLKEKTRASEVLKLTLQAGDVVLMQGTLQHAYLHKVPSEEEKSARINLTFRKVIT